MHAKIIHMQCECHVHCTPALAARSTDGLVGGQMKRTNENKLIVWMFDAHSASRLKECTQFTRRSHLHEMARTGNILARLMSI